MYFSMAQPLKSGALDFSAPQVSNKHALSIKKALLQSSH
jgi:hypothetical protein